MKKTILYLLLLGVLSGWAPQAWAQRAEVGADKVKGNEAKALLRQIETTRKELLEEHRQALIRAAQAKTPEEKVKIMQELQAAQAERKQKLREDAAKVAQADKQEKIDKKNAATAAKKS